MQSVYDEMRAILSYSLGYVPTYFYKGTPRMATVIDVVLKNAVPGMTCAEVLIMCQDLGCTNLMTYLLDQKWREVQDQDCLDR